MDPRIPVSWQLHPQNSQMPQYAFSSPLTPNYSHLSTDPDLTKAVARNNKTPFFAQRYPAINRIQHILANGQYPEYLYCVDQATIAGHLQKCCQESITFINDQYNAIQGDYPILTAYDCKIRDLELELMANESQEVSSTSLAAAHQSFERIYHVKKYILGMMRSRSALLHQDVSIRQVLLQIETSIHKCAQEMMPLQLRIKSTMGGMEDPSLRKYFYENVSRLLPLNSMREQKHAELQQCRATRADMEKRLSYVKARLTDS